MTSLAPAPQHAPNSKIKWLYRLAQRATQQQHKQERLRDADDHSIREKNGGIFGEQFPLSVEEVEFHTIRVNNRKRLREIFDDSRFKPAEVTISVFVAISADWVTIIVFVLLYCRLDENG